MLRGISAVHTTSWQYTFPKLVPISAYQPLQLHTRLFYVNSVESAASAMEGMYISTARSYNHKLICFLDQGLKVILN
jgi:hypothetical protein